MQTRSFFCGWSNRSKAPPKQSFLFLLLLLCLLGRLKCLTLPLLSLLSFFFHLFTSFHHHPVQHHLSWSSSSSETVSVLNSTKTVLFRLCYVMLYGHL